MYSDVTQKITDFFAGYPEHTIQKHELLARPDEPMPHVFYLVSGQVLQYDITPSGNEIVVNVFKPGAFFPMSNAINDIPNRYFFETASTVIVRPAPKQAVVAFLQDNPDVLFDLLSRVYRGVEGILQRMVHLMGSTARTRLLYELTNAASRFGRQQPDGAYLIALTEGDLARRAGLARETVSRLLRELKNTELISVTNKGIRITDLQKLQAALIST